MKKYLFIIPFLLIIGGCIGQKEETVNGRFTFPKTQLSIMVPENWLKSHIAGNPYPLLFTKVHYGIKPNIQLEDYAVDIGTEQAITAYLERKKTIYPDYTVIAETTFSTEDNLLHGTKIKAARINNDNIPIIHVSYIMNLKEKVYILSATCTKPSFEQYADVFDKTIKSIRIQ